MVVRIAMVRGQNPMKRIVFFSAVAALAAVPSMSGARQQSNCQWLGNVWTCTTTPAPPTINWPTPQPVNPADSFRQGWEQQEAFRRAREAREAREAQADAQRRANMKARVEATAARVKEERWQEAAKLVKAGDCDAARSLALDVADFELAKAVKETCTPTAESPANVAKPGP